MNGFVSLVGALAWPLATLGILIMYRQDLRDILGRVGRVKYRDVEVMFVDDLRKAETLAKSIPAPDRMVLEVESGASAPTLGGAIISGLEKHAAPRFDGLDRRAARSPREAVMEAWAVVGQALVKIASELGDRRAPAPIRAEDAYRFLVDRGWLAGPEAQLVERLRLLRDRVAHVEETLPSVEEARRYVEMALPLASRVATLGRSPRDPLDPAV